MEVKEVNLTFFFSLSLLPLEDGKKISGLRDEVAKNEVSASYYLGHIAEFVKQATKLFETPYFLATGGKRTMIFCKSQRQKVRSRPMSKRSRVGINYTHSRDCGKHRFRNCNRKK